MDEEKKWYLRAGEDTFGPESRSGLIAWARMGRIQPGQEVSCDGETWTRVEDVPFLDMRFSIDIGDGNPRGPFNKAAAEALLASGRLPKTASLVETREPWPEDGAGESAAGAEAQPGPHDVRAVAQTGDSQATDAPRIVVKEIPVEKIVIKEIPVEKIVEKIVEKEVPVEVEKIIEKRVEVPVEVEKIVEKIVEKPVIDETRVKELEELLEEERRHTARLQEKMDAAAAAAAERENALGEKMLKAAQESSAAEAALRVRIVELEEELRRLPQSAAEVADIQAAVYSLMTNEAEELASLMEREKTEADEFRRRHEERMDNLVQRRRELLKRAGANIAEMTHKALVNRPEDPRIAQLRDELESLRRTDERKLLDAQAQISELAEKLRVRETEDMRTAARQKDLAQLQDELNSMREKLQQKEKELQYERQTAENARQRQAIDRQSLMARLAALETPTIGAPQTPAPNTKSEAKLKLPRWMKLER